MTTAPVYIEDIIEEIVQATSGVVLSKIQANEVSVFGSTKIQQIRYSKSSFDELIETLAQADQSGEERFNKYPLVHLVQDLKIQRGRDIGIYGTAVLNIIFIHQTEQTYKMGDRDTKVFKPVLWPIYYEFMEQIKKSLWIFQSYVNTSEYPHDVIKRGFWGNRNLQGSKNILNDYVDAIEVQSIQLKFNFTNCP